jgi:hypothetical protein
MSSGDSLFMALVWEIMASSKWDINSLNKTVEALSTVFLLLSSFFGIQNWWSQNMKKWRSWLALRIAVQAIEEEEERARSAWVGWIDRIG